MELRMAIQNMQNADLRTAAQVILNTIAAIVGIGPCYPGRTPEDITRGMLRHFYRNAPMYYNFGNAPDAPSQDLVSEVPEHLLGDAFTIMAALVDIVRSSGGPQYPEIGLPMAYAADVVLRAERALRS